MPRTPSRPMPAGSLAHVQLALQAVRSKGRTVRDGGHTEKGKRERMHVNNGKTVGIRATRKFIMGTTVVEACYGAGGGGTSDQGYCRGRHLWVLFYQYLGVARVRVTSLFFGVYARIHHAVLVNPTRNCRGTVSHVAIQNQQPRAWFSMRCGGISASNVSKRCILQ